MKSVRPEPQISVVTVVWNNLEGLKATSENIADQTYSNIQHVVIDGSSTDGTPQWLEAYKPTYAVRMISEPDEGLYHAMNKGLRLVTGDVVVFLNGGDTFCDTEVLAFVAHEWSTGAWMWGYGGINYIDVNRTVLSQFNLTPFNARRVQLGLTYVPHPATFMSRELLTQLEGFRPEFGWSADQELGVRAALLATPVVWNRTLTDFLVGGAHSQGSLRDVARRYASIRASNRLALFGSSIVDEAYTEAVGTYWTVRAWASARLKSSVGVDSLRSS